LSEVWDHRIPVVDSLVWDLDFVLLGGILEDEGDSHRSPRDVEGSHHIPLVAVAVPVWGMSSGLHPWKPGHGQTLLADPFSCPCPSGGALGGGQVFPHRGHDVAPACP